jgi:hypothetical protein
MFSTTQSVKKVRYTIDIIGLYYICEGSWIASCPLYCRKANQSGNFLLCLFGRLVRLVKAIHAGPVAILLRRRGSAVIYSKYIGITDHFNTPLGAIRL